jgi:hypothetical protein
VWVELGVGALLVVATVLALLAGGTVRVAASTTGDGDPASSQRPTLVLQCPLGVHRLPAPVPEH